MYDTYLHKDKREKMHYEFISEEVWEFLKSRYGCDHEIKRYYAKGSGYYSLASVEARFKIVPVFICKSSDLFQDKAREMFSLSYMQMSGKKTFSDFKKRLVDILEANGYGEFKPEDFRMWRSESKPNLLKSFD